MKNRSEIDERYKWDLSPLCKNNQDFYEKLDKIKQYLPKFKEFEGKLNNKSDIYNYLMLEKEFEENIGPIYLYSHLKSCEILSDNDAQEMSEKISNILNDFSVETSFVASEFKKLPDDFLSDLIHDKKFSDYDRYFENIMKSKKHMLSKKEEKLLSGMDFLSGFSSVMEMLSDVDMKFGNIHDSQGKSYELNQSNYSKFMRSPDRKLRKQAVAKINGTFGKYINTFATNYISEVKANCYFAKIRKFKSALDSALFDEEIDAAIYNNLIKYVSKNLPVLFEYFEVKRKLLGLDEMHIYDCTADVGKGGEKEYTFDSAIDLIKKAVAPLGEEYVGLVEQARKQRWIDVFPNKDKSSGAFSSGVYNSYPYVLTNFEGTLDSVFTLAHELGHSMHTYFSNKTQPMSKSEYTIFLAEIASTTNEMLLLGYLLKHSQDKDEKIYLYNKLFDSVKSTIFRQTMFSEFEEKVHKLHQEGQPLTKDRLCGIYYVLNKKYFGTVNLIPEIKYEWARIPHFFRAFYVYKYATGEICAIHFANSLLSEGKPAAEKYLGFLSAGSSQPPNEILKTAGCDLANSATFDSCFDYLKSMLDEWKKLIEDKK